jgi:hypothetical protein
MYHAAGMGRHQRTQDVLHEGHGCSNRHRAIGHQLLRQGQPSHILKYQIGRLLQTRRPRTPARYWGG